MYKYVFKRELTQLPDTARNKPMAKIMCNEVAIKIITHSPLYRKYIISLQRRTHNSNHAQWHFKQLST